MGKKYSSRAFPALFGGKTGKIRNEPRGKDVGTGHGRNEREAIKNADKDRQKHGK